MYWTIDKTSRLCFICNSEIDKQVYMLFIRLFIYDYYEGKDLERMWII
jgi:hypothetical protein